MGNKLNDLTGQRFGRLTVIEYAGNRRWKCQCDCGGTTITSGSNLLSGSSRSCGCLRLELLRGKDRKVRQPENIEGQIINGWRVEEYLGKGKWKCSCTQCGETTIKRKIDIKKIACKCTKKPTRLIGYKFGEFIVEEYAGNKRWRCRCSCGNIKLLRPCDFNQYRSCGCQIRHNKMLAYGYNDEVARLLENRAELEEYVKQKYRGAKPTMYTLAQDLGVNYQIVARNVQKMGLSKLFNRKIGSQIEKEIADFVKSIYSGTMEQNNKKILGNRKEVDIYLPDRQLAIEVDGDYWHNEEYRGKRYHIDKTDLSESKGIRMIHIFEHEWVNKPEQVKQILRVIIGACENRIAARKTQIISVAAKEAQNFENKYHLQGRAVGESIRIGLQYNNELVGIMTLGKPRFGNRAQWEIIRLAWKDNTIVMGGASRMFKYFIEKYKPESVISYCRRDKFTGKVYAELGFAHIDNTEPGYCWVNKTHEIMHREKTRKQDLVAKGLGTSEETEDMIMHREGMSKLYDCGNAVYMWKRK